MKRQRTYHICYKLYQFDKERHIQVKAQSKEDAYVQATYYDIPYVNDGRLPYSVWVHSVTFDNRKYREFNNHEGHPY